MVRRTGAARLSPGRRLALDVGERRTGVAVSDPLGWTAQPAGRIVHQGGTELVEKLRSWVARYQPVEIVIGLPLRTDGRPGGGAVERAEAAAKRIGRAFGLPIVLWDERFSTVTARQMLEETEVWGARQKQAIDSLAAAVFLQAYLDSLRSGRGRSGRDHSSDPPQQEQERHPEKEQQDEPKG
ncbi:MAG: Holliday junction resolvase RuvX [Limnochordaceae bacterium]|nr:Holliday junction resolvase RuvX [Limnochordaceae bacterium]